MSDQTSRILNEVSEDEEFTEVHTPHSESFEKNIQRSEKSRQRNADEDKDSTIQQNDEIIFFLFEMQKRRCCAFKICSELVFWNNKLRILR